MSRHEGVSCDACMKANFRGRRYKCLICYDYDLCSVCYENGSTTNQHTAEHPMQCILTRHDFDIFHGGEPVSADHPQSLTCPFCGKMGYTESTLQEHVISNHTDVSYEVVCPICASVIGGDPNHITDDFADHLAVDHQAVNNSSESNSRHAMRRMPHQGRGINRGISRQSMRFGDSMDPIAELLSQLSGVRRSTAGATAGELTTSIHLHQEARMRRQMQLYRSNESYNSTNNVSKSQNNTGTATTGEAVSSMTGSSTQVTHAAPSNAASSNMPNVVPSYSTQTPSAPSASSKSQGQPSFLLTRLVELEKGDDTNNSVTSEKSVFVQELLFSTLTECSVETNNPIVELVYNMNLRDDEDSTESNTATKAADAGTQTEFVSIVSPSQLSGGFPIMKSLSHAVLKTSKGAAKPQMVNRSSPRLLTAQSPNSSTPLGHRFVTGSGTVSVPPVGGVGRGRIRPTEPLSPGVNRRKPVRGDGRAQPPP